VNYEPNFGDLPDGALFRFFEGGSLLTKTGAWTYTAPQWWHFGMTADPAQKVIPYDASLQETKNGMD
jgi:hypothetical protein